jgi:hypothetical protein
MLFPRTIAVIDKAIQDLARLLFVISVIVQILFIGLYGFKIWINWNQTALSRALLHPHRIVSCSGLAYYLIDPSSQN